MRGGVAVVGADAAAGHVDCAILSCEPEGVGVDGGGIAMRRNIRGERAAGGVAATRVAEGLVRAGIAIALGVIMAGCGSDAVGAPARVRSGTADGGGLHAASCTPDATAPVIVSTAATPDTLWAPNHKFVQVAIATSVSDECDSAPRCAISSVSSNEPVDGLGDGDTAPDWIVTGASTLLLRAERSGTGTGRLYTVGSTCTDASGNGAVGYATVSVPHDQENGTDDGGSE